MAAASYEIFESPARGVSGGGGVAARASGGGGIAAREQGGGGAGGSVRSSSGSPAARGSSASPPPAKDAADTRKALRAHLQTSFARLDRSGSGTAPTGRLVAGLRSLLASQTASVRTSRGWARGLTQICERLDGKLDEARLGGVAEAVEHLATGWEELLELADEVA